MDKYAKNIEKCLDKINNSNNFDEKIKLYQSVSENLERYEEQIMNLKNKIDGMKSVKLDEKQKKIMDDNEMFDHFITRLENIKNNYNDDLEIDEQIELYEEVNLMVLWCKDYLEKKELKINYLD
jgi:hypothetical protein